MTFLCLLLLLLTVKRRIIFFFLFSSEPFFSFSFSFLFLFVNRYTAIENIYFQSYSSFALFLSHSLAAHFGLFYYCIWYLVKKKKIYHLLTSAVKMLNNIVEPLQKNELRVKRNYECTHSTNDNILLLSKEFCFREIEKSKTDRQCQLLLCDAFVEITQN